MNVMTEQKIIKNKVELLKLAEQLDSVSKACKVMRFSRSSFYRFKDRSCKAAKPPCRNDPTRPSRMSFTPASSDANYTLQSGVDEWVRSYNEERMNSGKHCFGNIPDANLHRQQASGSCKTTGSDNV